MLGDARFPAAFDRLVALLKGRQLACAIVGGDCRGEAMGRPETIPPVLELLRANDDRDPVLRHAAVMALVGANDVKQLLAAANDDSPAVRMGVLLALRRLENPAAARFLHDSDPLLVVEAARAVHDLPLNSAMPELAQLIDRPAAGDAEVRDALLRRVLNANFRLGAAEHAAAVARFAARPDAPDGMRIECGSEMLAAWSHPFESRDRVTDGYGVRWRPRSAEIAADAMRSSLGGIFAANDKVRQVAVKVAGQLGIKEVIPVLVQWAADVKRPAKVRTQAMIAARTTARRPGCPRPWPMRDCRRRSGRAERGAANAG